MEKNGIHIDIDHIQNSHVTKQLVDKYIEQLSEQEIIVLKIAINHLGSSFDIIKSIGFKNWLKEQSTSNDNTQ